MAIALAASPALAQADKAAAKFWKSVQATCDTTAAKPAGELGQRIAQTAIDEFNRFGGHQIDANGRLFRFGLTEAEHEEDDGGARQATIGHLGWWQVMKYWQALYGNDAASKLEARGYRDASTATEETQEAALLRTDAARLLREAESVSDPAAREILREAALRAAIVDTSWSAAFVSYVVKQAGRRKAHSASPMRIAPISTTRLRPARPSRTRRPTITSTGRVLSCRPSPGSAT